MDRIYINGEEANFHCPGPRGLYTGVAVFLCIFLFAGIIILAVLYNHSVRDAELSTLKDNLTAERDLRLTKKLESLSEQNHKLNDSVAELSAIKDNLTELLQTSNDKLSSITKERDLLNANLAKMTKNLRCLFEPNKVCPAGWQMFSCSCYFLSEESGSWDKGRQDCRDKGADLVVIDSPEERMFLYISINNNMWIGLSDREVEGTWKWVDGTPLTLKYRGTKQLDNAGGDPESGEEDCVHIRHGYTTFWNDVSCEIPLQWICEKIP